MENEELWKKIETQVDGILDTLAQDKNSIVNKIDEELKDFILTLCMDMALPREKQIKELNDELSERMFDCNHCEFRFNANHKGYQLTRAKNYLRFLLGVVHIKNTYNDEIEKQIAEAAEFLKEEQD